jgi:hypothetical protein
VPTGETDVFEAPFPTAVFDVPGAVAAGAGLPVLPVLPGDAVSGARPVMPPRSRLACSLGRHFLGAGGHQVNEDPADHQQRRQSEEYSHSDLTFDLATALRRRNDYFTPSGAWPIITFVIGASADPLKSSQTLSGGPAGL